ncbi:MAG: DNA polymerase I, partial [Candidatus Marinimicrobia bacterium]|nr:DNA polymerase I [Candidatus Neomarinimicrobiota bacterium]
MAHRPRFFVLDGTALFYRGHYAMINNPLATSEGFITSGIFGFMNTLIMIMKDESPDYLVVTFDDKAPTFRKALYTDYKANRKPMPDELVAQIEPLDHVLAAMSMPVLRIPGFEADDIMGTLATKAYAKDWETFLVTSDKDMMQLVNDRTFVYMPPARRNPVIIYDSAKVAEKWGVGPGQLVDLLGLMGDASDNIPGVEGVGAKTAAKLLAQYGSLEGALDHADEVSGKRAREGLQNGREVALLSKELATIDCAVPLELELDSMDVGRLTAEGAAEELGKLEIRAVVPALMALAGKEMPAEEAAERPEKHYRLVQTAGELQALVDELTAADWISFDTETTSLDPLQAELVGMSFSTRPHEGWYVPVLYPGAGSSSSSSSNGSSSGSPPAGGSNIQHPDYLTLEQILAALGPILADGNRPLIGQNIKYDLQVMSRHNIELGGIVFDTIIAAHLIDPDGSSYKLDNLSLRQLNYRMVPIEELIGPRGKEQKSMAEVPLDEIAPYAAEDADVVGLLYPLFEKLLDADGLTPAMLDVETPLIPVLAGMERRGVYLDIPLLEQMSADLEVQLGGLQTKIIAAAGTEFNINSPQQLGVVLFDQLGLPQVRKRSTDVHVLEMLRDKHELPGLILDYRQVKKLKSTYVDAFPEQVNPDTGRVHTSFSQTVAATGRLSSSNPNFQNIPIRTEMGREIRKAFCAKEQGWSILSADYSQIELRVMAHLAREDTLLAAFRNGEDIHTRTAATVFGLPPEEVTADMRRTAKVVNFGIMYGAGPFRMAQELDIPIQEGKELIDRYFNTYPGIRRFIDELLIQAREDGYVSTILGRRRKVPNINADNHNLRTADERIAVNMPIQGTAAELIKIAMLAIHRRLADENFAAHMILQIHDELLFELPADEVDSLAAMVVA